MFKLKLTKSSICLLVLNVLLSLVVSLSVYIYTSYYNVFSWHESCGTQFLAIFIVSVPLLLGIGVIFYFLKKSLNISDINAMLPFIAVAIFGLPILLDGSLSFIMVSIGTILGVGVLVMTVIITFRNLLVQ